MRNMLDITLLLDDSGSMQTVAVAARNGVNKFVSEQRSNGKDTVFSLVKFHAPGQIFWVCRSIPLAHFPPLDSFNYNPNGNRTALYDSASRVIDELGGRLGSTPESARPNQVLMVIMTDGQNNVYDAGTFRQEDLTTRIAHQRSKYSWEFLYLGANHDAEAEAVKIAIPVSNALKYDHSARGTEAAFLNMACSTKEYAKSGNAAFNK